MAVIEDNWHWRGWGIPNGRRFHMGYVLHVLHCDAVSCMKMPAV